MIVLLTRVSFFALEILHSRDIEVIYIFIRRHHKNKAKSNLIFAHKKYISRNYNNARKRSWRQQISGFIKNLFISHFVK